MVVPRARGAAGLLPLLLLAEDAAAPSSDVRLMLSVELIDWVDWIGLDIFIFWLGFRCGQKYGQTNSVLFD